MKKSKGEKVASSLYVDGSKDEGFGSLTSPIFSDVRSWPKNFEHRLIVIVIRCERFIVLPDGLNSRPSKMGGVNIEVTARERAQITIKGTTRNIQRQINQALQCFPAEEGWCHNVKSFLTSPIESDDICRWSYQNGHTIENKRADRFVFASFNKRPYYDKKTGEHIPIDFLRTVVRKMPVGPCYLNVRQQTKLVCAIAPEDVND